MAKIIIVIAFVAVLMAVMAVIGYIHKDKRASKEQTQKDAPIFNDRTALVATPKQYGMYLIAMGIWRRNKLKNKLKH